MQKYEQLDSIRLARQTAIEVYRLTGSFPKSERFGLAEQLRRSAVSVGSNIAEGTGRATDADLKTFLVIARGSATELHFQLDLAARLGLADRGDIQSILELVERTKATLSGHIRYLR